jgi:ubiquinone/menaquinone biosynthesis C-methylase UbiE
VDPFDWKAVRAAYDTVAEDYVEAFADDLDGLPVDRSILDRAREQLDGVGLVLDLGCGPAQVAHNLTSHGIEVVGLDIATHMLRLAAARMNRDVFACGDMRALPFPSQSFRGVVAFYSIQHLPRSDLRIVLREIHRVLTSDGVLVVATHLGDGETQVHEFLGHEIEPVGGTFFSEEELRVALVDESFSWEASRRRDPLPHEYQSKRIYVMARRRPSFT